jgi:hypothetical protein
MDGNDPRLHFNVWMGMTTCGLLIWLFGASDWFWGGAFVDPAVVKVGKAMAAAAAPVAAWQMVRGVIRFAKMAPN